MQNKLFLMIKRNSSDSVIDSFPVKTVTQEALGLWVGMRCSNGGYGNKYSMSYEGNDLPTKGE